MKEPKLEPKRDVWEFYRIRCPDCNSKKIEEINKYRFLTFKKKPQQLHKCLSCGNEFWR